MKMVPLGEVVRFAYGKALKKSDRQAGPVPVVGSGGVVGTHQRGFTRGPTIVVGRKGSIGSVTWVDGSAWPIDTAYHVEPNRSGVDSRWTYWMLKQLGMENMNKSAAVPGLNRDDVYRLPILFPPLDEQRRIVAILDKADAIRQKRRQAIARLDVLNQSIFFTMFNDCDADTKPLAEVAQVWDCPHSTPKWTTSGEVCLRTPNLTRGGWDWTDTRYVDPGQFEKRSKGGGARSGDIILSREGTVGVAAVVEPDMRVCMGQRLVQVRVDQERLLPTFALGHLLVQLAPERISRTMVGSTAQHLNVKDLRALPMLIPSTALQAEYQSRVAALERIQRNSQLNLASADALFASLQSRAFRGEL